MNGLGSSSSCSKSSNGVPQKRKKQTKSAKQPKLAKTNPNITTIKNTEFDKLQNRVDKLSTDMEDMEQVLKRKGLEPYFQSLLREFDDLTTNFKKRLDGMNTFVGFLRRHNVAPHSAGAGYFAVLPEEVILHILSYLCEKHLVQLVCVSSEWKRLAEDNAIWRKLYIQRWNKNVDNFEEEGQNIIWKRYFKRYCLGRARVDRNWKEGRYQVLSFQHGSAVLCVSFNEDWIVSGSADETIRVWNVNSGECAYTLRGHIYTVKSLQFDSEKIISGGGTRDRTVKIWDMKTGKCEKTLKGHRGGIFTLQYDNEKLVTGATDKTIRIWSLDTLECLSVLSGHQHDVYCLQFDKFGRIVSGAGSGDRTLRLWDIESQTCVQEIRGHRGGVFCLHFKDDCVASGSKGEIKIWDIRSGKCINTVDKLHNNFILGIQFDYDKMVSGGYEEDFAVKLWDWRMMKLNHKLKGHAGNIRCVKFNANAIVSGAADKTVKNWDFSI